jgi:hypothetical protein
MGCLSLVIVVSLIAAGVRACSGGRSGTPDATQVTLNAQVRYVDGQLIITNDDDFAWVNVEFDLNPETRSSGYTYRAGRIEAHAMYTIGSRQFANSDGTMFDPLTQKPLRLSIHVDTPDSKDGWWFGEWK